jgi:SAM-dependent methyltransferase
VNRVHRRICASPAWAEMVRDELLPWALDGRDLGSDVLEIGPGFGATTEVLAGRVPRLVVVEIDAALATQLPGLVGRAGGVVCGDGTALPFVDASFDAVVCFTMLHHVTSPVLQDRLFAEVHRVLRPGGVFAGSDSRLNLRFRLIHLFDTMIPVDPATLPGRLAAAAFAGARVDVTDRRLRFAAMRPPPGAA